MALTQFSGSLSWQQLCGLAYAFSERSVGLRTRLAFRGGLVYQPSHMADLWVASAEAVAHVIPYSRAEFVCRGYAEGPSFFFRWAQLDGTGEVRAKKMSSGISLKLSGAPSVPYITLVASSSSKM